MRVAAYAHKLLSICEEHQGNLAAAVKHLEAAVARLLKCGPPGEDAAPWAVELHLAAVYSRLASVHQLRGNAAAAISANAAVIESPWPDPPGKSGITHAMLACSQLVVLHGELGDMKKSAARLAQWRSLLSAAGVGVPSDTAAYVKYAFCALGPRPERQPAEEALAVARRVWRKGHLLAPCLNCVAAARRADGDTAGALAALEESVAVLRACLEEQKQFGGYPPAELRWHALRALSQLAHARLGDSELSAFTALPAAKSAALRELAEASAIFCSMGTEGTLNEDYARLLMDTEKHIQFGPGDCVDDVPFELPSGRVVSLSEPYGAGRIAIWGQAISVLVRLHGTRSPRLIEPLTEFTQVLSTHNDVAQLAHVTDMLEALTAVTLGRNHAVARAAREHAAAAQENLGVVTASLRRDVAQRTGIDVGSAQFSGQDLQRHAEAMRAAGHLAPASPVELLEVARQHIDHAHDAGAAAKKLTKRLETPCAGCGAVRQLDALPYKACSTCRAVLYCNKDCQKKHWKQHKKECAALAAGAGGAAA